MTLPEKRALFKIRRDLICLSACFILLAAMFFAAIVYSYPIYNSFAKASYLPRETYHSFLDAFRWLAFCAVPGLILFLFVAAIMLIRSANRLNRFEKAITRSS